MKLAGATVCVTGGAGFIGSNIVARLCAADEHDVVVCDRLEGERFIETVRRMGCDHFRDYVYETPIADDLSLSGVEYALQGKAAPYDVPYYSRRF